MAGQSKSTGKRQNVQNVSTRQSSDKNDHREPMRETDMGSDRPAKDLGYLRSSWAPFGVWVSVPGNSVNCPRGAVLTSTHSGPSPWWPISHSPHGSFACSGLRAGLPLWAGFFFFFYQYPFPGKLVGPAFPHEDPWGQEP